MICSYIIFKNLETDQKLVQISPQIFLLNSRMCQRQDAFNLFDNQWLCFFDHDCKYTTELISNIEASLINKQKHLILAGRYLNPDKASVLQRAHNFVSNQWVSLSASEEYKHFLGGFFVIYCDQKLKNIVFADLPIWGGEDLALAIILQRNNYKVDVHEGLFVEHHTAKSLKHFFRRAWLHGKNGQIFKIENIKPNTVKIKQWSQKMKDLSFLVKGFVLLHFLILILARTVQKLRRLHS
jgi:hypothetical protein